MVSIFLSIINHELILVTVVILLFVISLFIPKLSWVWKFFLGILATLAVLNVLFGNLLSNKLIYRYGIEGIGVITNQEMTNNLYNEEPVIGYNVIIKTQENKTIETYFESWDFNIYPRPERGRYQYPNFGEEFNIKYLSDDPANFVILLNQNSTYSTRLNCSEIEESALQAKREMDFDPGNEGFRNKYRQLVERYSEEECNSNSLLLEEYKLWSENKES